MFNGFVTIVLNSDAVNFFSFFGTRSMFELKFESQIHDNRIISSIFSALKKGFLIFINVFVHFLFRRAVKATFVLIPLFGVHLFVTIYRIPISKTGGMEYERFTICIDNLQVCFYIFVWLKLRMLFESIKCTFSLTAKL